jgi:hypothetical protein
MPGPALAAFTRMLAGRKQAFLLLEFAGPAPAMIENAGSRSGTGTAPALSQPIREPVRGMAVADMLSRPAPSSSMSSLSDTRSRRSLSLNISLPSHGPLPPAPDPAPLIVHWRSIGSGPDALANLRLPKASDSSVSADRVARRWCGAASAARAGSGLRSVAAKRQNEQDMGFRPRSWRRRLSGRPRRAASR